MLTVVVAVRRWDVGTDSIHTALQSFPKLPPAVADSPYGGFVTALDSSGFAQRGIDVKIDVSGHPILTPSHLYLITGPTALGPTMAPVRIICSPNGKEVKQANLIIADLESMKPASVATLITSVADYVLVVDVGPEGAAGAGRIKNHDVLADVVMPAAVAARATLLGLVQEYGVSAQGSAATDVADMLHATAKQAGTPCHVEVPAISRKVGAGVAQDVVAHLLPKLLFDALPSAGAVGPVEPFASDRVLRFLEHRGDTAHMGTQSTGDDGATRRVQVGDGDSADELLDATTYGGDAVAHPLMPVLRVHHRLRASLPLRCVLVSHFPQRQVALMYVVQGVMRRGESLMAANLHYMGVTSEEAKAVMPEWDTLVDDCRVQTLSQYPLPCPVDVAYPGEFVTVQLKKGAAHVASAPAPPTDKKAKPTPSGCFLETLPTWSLCGKLPGAGATGVDALFPRPFAVAQWSLSEVYRQTTSALPLRYFDGVSYGYTGGPDMTSRCTLVGCGQMGLHQSKQAITDNTVLWNSIATNTNQGMEVSYDTHTHLLGTGGGERRGLLIFKKDDMEQATVVKVSILLRKLSLFMTAAAGAMGANPSPPTTFVDMVENVGVVTGREGGHVDVAPVSEDVRHLLRVAAGNEVAYELPLRLLRDLGVFNVDSIPAGSPVRVAIEEGSSDFCSINHQPTSDDLVSMTLIKEQPSTHKAAGSPVGPWLLLASAYHHHCEAGKSDASVGVGRSLIAAATWAAIVKDAPRTSALYMCGRHSSGANIVPCSHIRAARGPAYLPFLSAHTRRLFNARVGKLLPFDTLWRCVLPALVREWGAGRIHEPKLWVGMLSTASITITREKGVNPFVYFFAISRLLLKENKCSLEALSHLICCSAHVVEETHSYPCYGKEWSVPIIKTTFMSETPLYLLSKAGGSSPSYAVSDCVANHINDWFVSVGGERVLGCPLYDAFRGGHYELPALLKGIHQNRIPTPDAKRTLNTSIRLITLLRLYTYLMLRRVAGKTSSPVDVTACIASFLH